MIASSTFRTSHRKSPASRRRGLALVVILACVVLLTVMVMAYFSYSSLQRQISSSSANQTSSDIFALGAANSVIGDLKQEIAAGSTITPITIGAVKVTNFFPATAAAAVPAIAGFATNAGLENLVKVSRYGTDFFPASYLNAGAYGPSSRAINLSTTNASKNGRYVSAEDWNKPLLLGRLDTNGATDDTPVAAFVPPDWILVNRAGGNPSNPAISSVQWTPDAANTNAVIGRYAYAVYDEGGLLDANVAGYPSGMPATNAAFKSALAYADLTRVGLTTAQIDELVKWRNHATIEGGAKAANYPAFIAGNTSGFLRAANTNLFSGKSDQLFVSRRQLLGFFNKALGGSTTPSVRNALQYLTHFSRDLDQPSYVAPVQTNSSSPVVLPASLGGNNETGGDKFINPSFPGTRVQAAFLRNDGTTAKVGDPLVNKRFPLNRLAWITYNGPSASRSQSAPDIQSLIANGIPWTYLQEGTAANIEKHFGLTWDSSNKRWVYDVHRGTSGGSRIIKMLGRPANVPAPNATGYVQDSDRDANFFELLKAGISLGSLGKAATTSQTAVPFVPPGYNAIEVPLNLRYAFDSSVDYHIIQIGANILNEVNPTSYPVRIAFDDGLRGIWEFQGVTDLPYLQYVFNGVIRTQAPNPPHPVGPGNQAVDSSPHQYPIALTNVTLTNPGNAYMVQVPGVWNPYDPNGTPGVLRPARFRVVIDSNDPSAPSGSGNKLLCHFAAASKSTTASNNGNEGMGPPNAKYSYESDVTVGKTLEQFNAGPGTVVYDAVTFGDNNGALYREPTLIFDTSAPGNATRVGALSGATPSSNIASIDPNPLPNSPAGSSSGPYAPLVLGQFPLAFAFTSSSVTTTCYTGHGFLALSQGNGDNRVYFTYRLQYQDPTDANNWITYDTKYGRTTHGLFGFQNNYHLTTPGASPSVVKGPEWYSTYSWASAIDPRTDRFGLIMDTFNGGRSRASFGWAPADTGWIYDSGGTTTTLGITYPIRPDNSVGFGFVNLDVANTPPGGRTAGQTLLSMGAFSTRDIPYPSFSAGWTSPAILVNNGGRLIDVYMFAPGMYQQNNPSAHFYGGSTTAGPQPSYYADADGVVRRAMGAYVPLLGGGADSTVGLPASSINGYPLAPQALTTPATKTPFTQSQSRPLLLHRPFRTVAELGTVFRDLPWKNLDFFTPESGDAALLDLFCINETDTPNGLAAGKVNLNTRQAPVLEAIISGAYVDDPKVSNATVGSLSPVLSRAIATALTAYTADTAAYGPVKNIADLIGSWKSHVANSPRSGVVYDPAIATANCGVDLPASDYKDGKSSYVGFSGATAVASPAKELTSVYAAAANFGNPSLQTSVSQIQRFREAPLRALAGAGQTRVWNLLIDLVAQVGRYPSTAAGASDPLAGFLVEGETRLWVHVSIDRLTGEILDKQIEVVKE